MTSNKTPLHDIRIGTMLGIAEAPALLPQVLPMGFESYQLNGGWGVEIVDFKTIAAKCKDLIGDKAVVSSIGFFGNPIQVPAQVEVFAAYIDNAHHFGTNIVTGFAGAIDDKPVMDAWPMFKKVWSELGKRAADRGVKIAFENCDMGGMWHAARFNLAHSPTVWDMMWNEIPEANLGLCWEPCHQMVSLIDPIPQLRKLAHDKKIFTVHGKDATIAWDVLRTKGLRGGQPFVWHRTPGFGDTNWTDVISILRMEGFKGSIDIEGWHDPVYKAELEYTGQIHALNYLKNCRGGSTFVPNPVK